MKKLIMIASVFVLITGLLLSGIAYGGDGDIPMPPIPISDEQVSKNNEEKLSGEERERLYTSAAEHGILRQQLVIRDEASLQMERTSDSEIVRSVLEHSDRQVQMLLDSIAVLNEKLSAYRQLGLDSLLTKQP